MRNRLAWLGIAALVAVAFLVGGCAPDVLPVTGAAQRMGWVAQQSGTGNHLFGVCATSSTDVWAVGEAGVLLRTTDGGAHWRSVSTRTWVDLRAVTFRDQMHGWVLADNRIMRTTDGGESWSTVKLDSELDLEDLAFTDSLNGVAVGFAWRGDRPTGIILRTVDGGTTWRTAWEADARAGESAAVSAVGVRDRRHLVAVDGGLMTTSGGGVVLSSEDAGASWSRLARSDVAIGIDALRFTDQREGWAVGEADVSGDDGSRLESGRIVRSRDGGRTWRLLRETAGTYLSAIAFPSAREGWAVGGAGTLLHTTDGGEHWSTVPGLPGSRGIYSASFFDSRHGWVVGDDGCIYAYRQSASPTGTAVP